uniref:NADH dehydrogenase subunit 3 n=1 Tax=Allonothrus sinicus TaxID=3138099 RepID=UPI00315C7506
MKMAAIVLIVMMTLTALMMVVKVVHKTEKSYKSKWNQFECGFNIMTPPHIPFSFQFFLIALLFLIFDVEITLVLSFPLESKSNENLIYLIMFLLFLTIGLIYEWKKGKIDWSK